MTPIVSRDDIRLATLIGVVINCCEEMALHRHQNPGEILAENLYLTRCQIDDSGADMLINKLATNYPILNEAIK